MAWVEIKIQLQKRIMEIKTYNGNKDSLLLEVHVPPFKKNNTTL